MQGFAINLITAVAILEIDCVSFPGETDKPTSGKMVSPPETTSFR
jgi:hypothetical protein